MPDRTITLSFAADRQYVLPLAAAIRSATASLHEPGRPVHIVIFETDLTSADKRRVERSVDHAPTTFQWIRPSAADFQGLPVTDLFPMSALYRLLLPSVLPGRDKVIYLDVDLIVLDDLAELWDMPMRDAYVLAVQDAFGPLLSKAPGLAHLEALRSNTKAKYFNSGVLVIDLARWRADKIVDKAMAWLRQNAARVIYPDQDALNALFVDRWIELEPRWNQMHFLHQQTSQTTCYAPAAFDRALREPAIVHYSSRPKPWMHGCDHPLRGRFFEFVDATPWRGWRYTWRRRMRDKVRRRLHRWIGR